MGPEDGELEDAAVRRLSELGVECSFRGNAVHGTRKISSTTFLKERLDDFYAAFEDDVDCVVCSQ
jgi:muramoyltetrapeptide carboxypeptidase LdcA involved in peptidoglycan recycling